MSGAQLDELSPIRLVKIGGEDLKIEFTMWALRQFQRLTGINLLGGDSNLNDPDNLAALIWAGLIAHQPQFDGEISEALKPSAEVRAQIDRISKSLSLSQMIEASKAVFEALAAGTGTKLQDGAAAEDEAAEKKI